MEFFLSAAVPIYNKVALELRKMKISEVLDLDRPSASPVINHVNLGGLFK